jgi:DNA-binding PadR family transcriptional regulator
MSESSKGSGGSSGLLDALPTDKLLDALPTDKLTEVAETLLKTMAGKAADAAVDQIENLTSKLTDGAENGGQGLGSALDGSDGSSSVTNTLKSGVSTLTSGVGNTMSQPHRTSVATKGPPQGTQTRTGGAGRPSAQNPQSGARNPRAGVRVRERGQFDLMVLSVVAARPGSNGYRIAEALRDKTQQRVAVPEQTVFSSLVRLRRNRLLRRANGGYELTYSGQRSLIAKRREWQTLQTAMTSLLEAVG